MVVLRIEKAALYFNTMHVDAKQETATIKTNQYSTEHIRQNIQRSSAVDVDGSVNDD